MTTTIAETYDFFTVTRARKKIGLEKDTESFTLGIGRMYVGYLAVNFLTVLQYSGFTDDATSSVEKLSNAKYLKKIDFDFSDSKVKRRKNKYGYLKYMDKTGSRYRCIVYAQRLGAVLGSEYVFGRLCLNTGHRDVEKLDQRLFELIENLRTDGSGKQLTALKPPPLRTVPADAQPFWRGLVAFDKYRELRAFKAFALKPYSSRWGYGYGSRTPQGAINKAMSHCEKDKWKCELYAVGNTVVAGMSPEQLAAVIEQYKKRDGPGDP